MTIAIILLAMFGALCIAVALVKIDPVPNEPVDMDVDVDSVEPPEDHDYIFCSGHVDAIPVEPQDRRYFVVPGCNFPESEGSRHGR